MVIEITIQLILVIIQSITTIITLISVILIYKTIKSNEILNQRVIFNEVIKQERELRIKLSEYREKIHGKKIKKDERKSTELDHNTLLFNYYEYLAICLYKRIIDEKETKLYFEERLRYVKDLFDSSLLFKEGYAEKEQYKALQWLFKKGDIH
jgi:hypothetical protein